MKKTYVTYKRHSEKAVNWRFHPAYTYTCYYWWQCHHQRYHVELEHWQHTCNKYNYIYSIQLLYNVKDKTL